jgi:hypothetical protein
MTSTTSHHSPGAHPPRPARSPRFRAPLAAVAAALLVAATACASGGSADLAAACEDVDLAGLQAAAEDVEVASGNLDALPTSATQDEITNDIVALLEASGTLFNDLGSELGPVFDAAAAESGDDVYRNTADLFTSAGGQFSDIASQAREEGASAGVITALENVGGALDAEFGANPVDERLSQLLDDTPECSQLGSELEGLLNRAFQ